ncbi:MAG TPA: SDR family oxidoreductase [Terriglobia bacterium]|jgi:NAD(P)-dependent dehydrogenase (short-subunit alcohol dehydrogenase family)|nr:SDR family oxidoreductase [Terriglobia bacterium]
MLFKDEFQGRVAVVTGGSEGIGYEICRQLAESGCQVYFCARHAHKGLKAAESMGGYAHYIPADLRVPADIDAFASKVAEAAGRVDYLVNNAANDDRIVFSDATVEEADRMWTLNLRSYILMSRACLELLRAGKGKSVVNIGTTNYMMGFEPFTLYNATKSGILGFTRSLARELGHDGIRVNMLSPGWIMTEKQLRLYVTEKDKEELIRDQSLKFLLDATHVSPAVLFLLSSAACGITGQNLVVDGGKYMQ